MTEICDVYIEEIQQFLRKIEDLLSKLETEPKGLKEASDFLSQADESIKQLEIEARNLPGDLRVEMLKKVQQYRDACKAKKTQISTYRTKAERSELFSGVSVSEKGKDSIEAQMAQLSQQNNTLENARRTLMEAENSGLGTMDELQRQRESLQSSRDKVQDTLSLTNQAKSILDKMRKRVWYKRV
ncbi:hypothetical protein WA158_005465 [Blastocystis sp. Blastoise]